MNSPVPWYGSKKAQAKRIAALCASIPHDRYVELFAGAAAVYYAKPSVDRALLNDLNPWAMATHRAIKLRQEELIDALPACAAADVEGIPTRGPSAEVIAALPDGFGNADWRESVIDVRNNTLAGDDVVDAITQIKAWQYSYNSSPWSGAQSGRMTLQLARRIASGQLASDIRAASLHLRGTALYVGDALVALDYVGSGDLVYCDPPYMRFEHGGGSRGAAYAGYGPYDPDAEWHGRFLDAVGKAKSRGARFVISTGMDDLYRQRLPEMGFIEAWSHGTEGRGPGRGGMATAKHLVWTQEG